ncbi:MAG: hypothetical protein K8R21_01280 [Leptospira sp.]|nr:hypothetical protein [Leptospira sp.]
MKTKIIIVVVLILCFILIACFYLLQWNPFNPLHEASLKIGNRDRDFSFYIPEGLVAKPKLLFVVHGSDMKAASMQLITGHQFDKLAEKEKDFIIVYPQGFRKYWNDCRKEATYDANKLNVDELLFFEAMIDYFVENYGIEKKAVFVTGFSNGGHMAFKIALERPTMLLGIAAVSANLPIESNDDCSASNKPVSVLVINGTSDPINPYNGGVVEVGDGQKRGAVVSTDETLNYWLRSAKCNSSLAKENDFPDIETSDKSKAVQFFFDCKETGKKVSLIKVMNGGHIYPNPTFFLWPKELGNVNKDINAPEIVLNFFRSLL